MQHELGSQWLNAVLTALRPSRYRHDPTAHHRHRSLWSPRRDSSDIGAIGEELVASGQGSSRNVILRREGRSAPSVTVSLSPVFDTASHVSSIIGIVRVRNTAEAPISVVDPTMMGSVKWPDNLPQEGQSAVGGLVVARLTRGSSEPLSATARRLRGA